MEDARCAGAGQALHLEPAWQSPVAASPYRGATETQHTAIANLAPAEIVNRLVALNTERAAEERAGTMRWLRSEYQIPQFDAEKPE